MERWGEMGRLIIIVTWVHLCLSYSDMGSYSFAYGASSYSSSEASKDACLLLSAGPEVCRLFVRGSTWSDAVGISLG